MHKGNSTNLIAILVSIGLHALFLLIPWQPAPVVLLLPLEGTGVVELAVMQPINGVPEATIEQVDKPIEEVAPQQVPPVTKPVTAKPKVTKTQVTAVQPVQKPIVSIKPTQPVVTEKPPDEVITSPEGSAIVPASEIENVASETTAEPPTQDQQEVLPESIPIRPVYPGDDPTGEVMVASKRAVAYPKESMSSSSEGDVLVEVIVGTEGKITGTRVLSGPSDELLRRNAEQTILKYWAFKAADRAYKVLIEVTFRMQPVAVTTQRFVSASFLD